MRRNHTYKRGLSLLLCLAMMVSLLSGCADKASTIRLEKAQGTIGVEDDKNAWVEVREGMQLYSGYKVGTATASQAWIGLDDAKAIKLPAISSAQILKSGSKLTVKLNEGQVFFDVSQPLGAEETFTIETSTMITGIRGTSGWMEILDPYTTRLVVLEGTVTVTSYDPETGELRTITVTGGQIITVVYYGKGQGGAGGAGGSGITDGPGGAGSAGSGGEDAAIQELISDNVIISENIIHTENGLRVEELQEEQIPEFVREEIAKSPKIQEKIAQNPNLSLPEILAGMENLELPEDVTIGPGSETNAAPEAGSESGPAQETGTPPDEAPEPTSVVIETTTQWSIVETEVYYEEVVEEWTELRVIDGTVPTTAAPGEGGGTGGENPNPGEGENPDPGVTPEPEVTVSAPQYRPLIQLMPSDGNPTYAVIIQANETTTTTIQRDASGNIVSFNEDSVVKPVDGAAVQYDYNLADGTVDFKDLNGTWVSMPVDTLQPEGPT